MNNNDKKAIELYELAISLLKENNPDFDKAYELCEKSASLNNSYAINALGNFYLEGFSVKQDYDKALYYFKKAYYLKNPKAAYNLSLAYQKGYGVNIDEEKADEYFAIMFDYAIERIIKGDMIAEVFLVDDLDIGKVEVKKMVDNYSNNKENK